MTAFDLNEFAASCGVKNPAEFLGKCEILRKFLEEYNRNVNLTRLTSPEDFYAKHVADSLSIAHFFPEITTEKLKIADIGCGAGFPSLILALAYPLLEITAIDSIGKKITFVKLASEKLLLDNLTAIHGRSVELNCRQEYQHRFDIVTARAVAPSPKICREASRFPAKNGRFIFYKTPQQSAEERPELDKLSNMRWENSPVFTLPGDAGERLFSTGKYLKNS